MIIPVRCFSCGKPVTRHYQAWLKYLANEKPGEDGDRIKFFEGNRIRRYCCRKELLTSVNLMDKL